MLTRRRIAQTVGLAVAAALSLTALQAPASANDDSATNGLAERVAAGAARAGDPAAAANPSVSIPASGGGDITVATEAGEGSLRVPASGEAKTAIDGTKVFNGTAKDSAVAIQTTNGGVRVALDIKSADAPESYDFVFGGDISKLTLNADGSVTAGNKGGEPTGEIAAPWAYDANGKPVPTHYKIDGTTLTQVIEHKAGNYVYGITADPSWWWAAKCGTQIGIFLLENAAAPGKIVKILKAGATTFSKLLKSKGSKAKAIKWLAYEVSGAKGIATVVEKCWP